MSREPDRSKLLELRLKQREQLYRRIESNSFILKNQLTPQQPSLVAQAGALLFVSNAIILLLHPLDSLKVRAQNNCKGQDVCGFTKFQSNKLPIYKGLFYSLALTSFSVCPVLLGDSSIPAALLLGYPLNISRVRAQMGNMLKDLYKFNFRHCFLAYTIRQLLMVGGLRLTQCLRDPASKPSTQLNFSIAGLFLCTILSHPFDFAFSRLAGQTIPKYRGLVDCLRTVAREEGMRVVSGFGPRLASGCLSLWLCNSYYGQTLHKFDKAYRNYYNMP